ncbi:MAG: hypothetical protein AAF699_17230 [Pseudomonadota bacterium]
MTDELNDEDLHQEAKGIRDEMLLDTALKALLYGAAAYAYSHFFPAQVWQWYVFGAYILFNIVLVLYGYYVSAKLRRNRHG